MGNTKYYALIRFIASLNPKSENMAYSPYCDTDAEYFGMLRFYKNKKRWMKTYKRWSKKKV